MEKRKKVLALQTDFQRVCNEEKGGIWFEKEELRGVPEDVVSGFKQGDDGRLWVTFKVGATASFQICVDLMLFSISKDARYHSPLQIR